jgi:hypothetical protein
MPDPIYGPIGGCAPGAVGYGNQAATLSQARSHPMGILPRERLELTRFSTMLGDWYRLMDDLEGHPN